MGKNCAHIEVHKILKFLDTLLFCQLDCVIQLKNWTLYTIVIYRTFLSDKKEYGKFWNFSCPPIQDLLVLQYTLNFESD
jgi:hypothetical protein